MNKRHMALLVVVPLFKCTFWCLAGEATNIISPSPETPLSVMLHCYEGNPSLDVLIARLQSARKVVEGTDIEDDVLLSLAIAEEQNKDYEAAIKHLQVLKSDLTSTRIDRESMLGGYVQPWPRKTAEIGSRGEEIKLTSKTCDHALLLLANVYEKKGSVEAAWQTFEELRAKYPKGSNVQEIKERILAITRTNPRASPSARVQGLLRFTPHLSGLLEQSRMAKQYPQFASQRLKVMESIVRLYEPILDDNELIYDCDEGLQEIAKHKIKDGIEDTKQFFLDARDAAQKRKKEADTKR